MRQTNTRPTVEAGIMSAIAVIFALISVYVPVVGAFVTFLWPVPIILLGVRHGFRWSVMATVVAGVLSAILISPFKAVNIVVGFGLVGLVFGHAFRAGFGPFKTILWGSVVCLISNLALMGLTFVVMGINPFNLQIETMEKAMTEAVEFYRGYGMTEAALAQMRQQFKVMMTLFQVLLPALLAMSAVFQTYLNFILARAVLRKLGHQTISFPPFKEWSLPRQMLHFVTLAAATLFIGQYLHHELIGKIGLNLLGVAAILLFGQGLALFYFLADKYNLSRLMRNIILIMILVNSFLQIAAVFAGFFDLAVGYRQQNTPRSS
ncbi:YybS family protein [Anaeroselena agilis]|uniref:YybS family protein n=1 Tax=Anaeroselena agilis TaxID=3063788 RepID=A0ABU3P2M2_9FIRM|nr:YybS family protein [Selenomonadales bacterium 4137-cl]